MTINSVIHTNEQSIDRVLNAGLPVLLVFWRADSPAGKELDMRLDRLAKQYAGKALIAKVDVNDERALAQRFDIANVPSVVFVKNGSTEGTAVGAVDDRALRSWLDYLVTGAAKPAGASGPSESLTGGAPSQAGYSNGRAATSTRANGGGQTCGGQGAPITLTDANFDSVIKQPGPVLVDFWAPWCGPCRMVAPAVEQLAREFQGRATVGKLNVDENQAVAGRYGIMSIPALYIFKNGQVVEKIIGAQPAAALRQQLMRHV